MECQANKHITNREFEVGTWVYLKLQPHKQVTVRQGQQHKLSAKYYGLFFIKERVGRAAIKKGQQMGSLPQPKEDGLLDYKPMEILERRLEKVNNKPIEFRYFDHSGMLVPPRISKKKYVAKEKSGTALHEYAVSFLDGYGVLVFQYNSLNIPRLSSKMILKVNTLPLTASSAISATYQKFRRSSRRVSMKMRQYIAITDHILWEIITNGDQATTELSSASGQPSVPKTSIATNAKRNNEKALNILLSAIPDRHLLSFRDAQDAKTLWAAIKARFGGNEASKKM
ncbi:hypothetical protein Tco_0316292 [Tanacetum coccineum]